MVVKCGFHEKAQRDAASSVESYARNNRSFHNKNREGDPRSSRITFSVLADTTQLKALRSFNVIDGGISLVKLLVDREPSCCKSHTRITVSIQDN